MILVHFHEHSREMGGGFEDWIRTAIWRGVEDKSFGTFALLFGAGFALQLRRADARGTPFVLSYFRRLAVLAVFGFIAHAFFGFNVLLTYAVWGVPLLLIRRWSTCALIITAILSAVSLSLYWLAVWCVARVIGGPEAAAAAIDRHPEIARQVIS